MTIFAVGRCGTIRWCIEPPGATFGMVRWATAGTSCTSRSDHLRVGAAGVAAIFGALIGVAMLLASSACFALRARTIASRIVDFLYVVIKARPMDVTNGETSRKLSGDKRLRKCAGVVLRCYWMRAPADGRDLLTVVLLPIQLLVRLVLHVAQR